MNLLKLLRYRHRAWKARRHNERAEIAAMLDLLRPGDTVLDIGAHKGSYLYWLRQAVGAQGRVLAFEPQPLLAAYLHEVVAAMGWKNVTVENQGISDRHGTLALHIPGAAGAVSPGATFEANVSPGAAGRTCEVGVTTLDDLFPAGSKPPAFIKCDVEGHELAVFRGGERLLRGSRPTLLFECEARHLGGRPITEIFALLEAWGYTGRFFAPGGLLPLGEFLPEVHQRGDTLRFWDASDYCNKFLFEALPSPGPRQ